MITVYSADATDFSTNGLGSLTPESCLVSETLNGEYEVTLIHPIDEAGKFLRLAEGNILRVPVPAGKTPYIRMQAQTATNVQIYKVTTDGRRLNLRAAPNGKILGSYKPGTEIVVIDRTTNSEWSEVTAPDGKHGWMWTGNLEYVRTETTGEAAEESIKEAAILRDQPFRIYKIVPTLENITAYARHIFYDLMDNMVSSYSPGAAATGAAAFQGLGAATLSEHEFTFYSDLGSTAEGVEIIDKNPAEAILDDGGLIENYGGELQRDWWDVYLAERIGEETQIHIREGKNLLGISYGIDQTNVATRIIPRGEDADGEYLYLPEKYIESANVGKYPTVKWYVLDVKDAKEKTSGDEKRTKEECYTLMREAARAAFDEGADLPDVTLKVEFIDCAETEEYSQYRNLQGIHMGDTVRVVAKRVGVEVAMRMTQYAYNCLTGRYESMTLGTVDATIEGNMINPRSIGSGTIKGSMLKLGSVGTGQLIDGAVNGLKIALAAIDYAHISMATINQLSANSITAIRADIRELVAGNITTDQLYADLATIAAAQITAANIEKANIQWAQIENLSAEIAKVVNAEIENLEVDWAGIYEADIEWANITNLTAEIAKITAAEIGKAKINWAQIVDVKIGTADIEDASINTAKIALGAITSALIKAGAIGTAQIADGSITSAKVVDLSADVIKSGTLSTDRLLIKGAGGLFYEINATAGGLTSTQLTQEQYKNAISGTALVAKSVTADQIAAKTITANEILSGTITAAEINVANLFAADATIAALNNYILRTQTIEAIEGKLDVWADEKIRIAVDNIQIGGRNLLLNTGKLVIGNYAFDASGADAQGTVSGNGEGGLMIVCAQQNVRWWLGSVKVTPGQRYAISVRYKISSGTSPIQFQYVYRNSSYAAVVYGGSSATQTTRLEDGWTVLSDVLTVPDNAAIDHVELAVRTGADYALYTVEYQVCRPKFEAGSRATDWTPAPEDGELEVKRLEAELSVQAGKITANATKIETVNQAAANAQSAANAAQNAANGAQGTANNAVTRVTTAEQRISAVEGAITSKVEKADFDALGNKVSANTSAITQTAEAIRSEVASSVSGLQTQIEQTDEQVLILAGRTVGGTNLLRAAEGRIGLSSGVIDRAWEKSAWCQSGIGIVMQPTTAEYINAEYWSPFPVTAGEYTLSFWCWTYGIDVQPTIRCNLYNNDPARDHYFGDIQPGANTPVRYTITFTVDYTQSVWLRFLTWTQFTAGEIYISDAKLERGGAATAWSPHPEEFGAGSSVKINENEVSITTPKYSVDVVSEDGTTTALLINESGATFDVAYARNLAYCYYGPAEITVNPNATGSELAAGGVYRSLGEALDALSGRFIPYGVTINIAGDIYGSASLFNAFGHGITINSDGYTLYGALNFDQTGCAISVNNLTVNRPESSANHHALYAYQCRGFVNLYQCTFIGGTETAVNIAQGTKVWMHECEVRGAYNLIYLWYCSDLQALNLKGGDCTNFLIVNGATARLGGTRPDGSWEEWNQSDVLPADPSALTIDYGTATPTAPTIQTASYAMVNADSYAEGYVNSWDWEYRGDDDDVRQGYTEQVGRIYGCMWFDNAAIRSAVAGKTVNQASLRLTAQKYVGRGVAVSVHLWGTATEYAGRSGRPAATADYGIIGTATPGETVTITIPAQAAADLANGTTNGLMLLSDDTALYKDRNYSENYMRFDGETSGDANTRPVLTVVYQ